MMNNQVPDFKPNYKYQNIGNIVGKLTYAKEATRKDGSAYGYEFLVNAQGYGSINVKIPMMQKAQDSFDNFPVAEKPLIRAGLTQIDQFITDKGKMYTNATSFVELQEGVTVNGEEMKQSIAGRLSGEAFNVRREGDVIKLSLVTYPTDRDDSSKRAVNRNGEPVQAQILHLEVHDDNIKQQFNQQVQNGANIEVGYRYINQNKKEYDEFGFEVTGESVDRLEVGKVVVHSSLQQQPQNAANGYNANPNMPNQMNNSFGNAPQGNMQPQDTFAGQGQPVTPEMQQQVDQLFGGGQPQQPTQGNGFGY